jgi:N-acetylglucosamine malate deacetylase 2
MSPWVTAGVSRGLAARYVPATGSSLRLADPAPAPAAPPTPAATPTPPTPAATPVSAAPTAPTVAVASPAQAVAATPATSAACGPLPRAEKVLAVIARPGQESADLGALLYALRRAGTSLALLCVTRGEASPLNSTCERLETRRPWELLVAGAVLGVSSVTVADYPDGGLTRIPLAELTELVSREIRRYTPDLLLVVDPAPASHGAAMRAGDNPGHAGLAGDNSDDAVVATAARCAAKQAGVPVVARTRPGACGARQVGLGADPVTARTVQRSAAAAHVSQSEAWPEVECHLGLLGGRESLRWLVFAPQA